MAELSTLARPYAEALFATARDDAASLDAWANRLSLLAQLVANAEVHEVLTSPQLDVQGRVGVLRSLLASASGNAASSAAVDNFLQLLAENGRTDLLPEIEHQFTELRLQFEGSAEAQIESAFELPETELAALIAGLEKKFSVKLKPSVRIEPSLIGGVRVTVGDQVLDASVRARLDRMRDTLVAS